MHIVLVHIHVKSEFIQQFITATIDNASNSIKESGIARFDFIQQADDPNRFVLIEVYNSPADQLKHRETVHYLRWRDTVTDMMAETRFGVKYGSIYPDENGWKA